MSLLVLSSDPNSSDTEGRTALMWAAGQGQAEVLRTLLEHSSDVLLYDKTGSTALHIAAARGHIECIYILIQVCTCTPTSVGCGDWSFSDGSRSGEGLQLPHSKSPVKFVKGAMSDEMPFFAAVPVCRALVYTIVFLLPLTHVMSF